MFLSCSAASLFIQQSLLYPLTLWERDLKYSSQLRV